MLHSNLKIPRKFTGVIIRVGDKACKLESYFDEFNDRVTQLLKDNRPPDISNAFSAIKIKHYRSTANIIELFDDEIPAALDAYSDPYGKRTIVLELYWQGKVYEKISVVTNAV